MNEKIKELAKKSDIKIDYFGYGFDVDGGNPNVEKFAELIIKECMVLSDLPHSVDGKYDDFLPSQMIAQHFGV